MRKRTGSRRLVTAVAAIVVLVPTGVAAGAAGDLDPTFGVDGTTITDFDGRVEFARAVALRPHGGIVTAGESFAGGDSVIALAAYASNGALDQTFGDAGRVLTDLGGLDAANAVAVYPDGRVIVAGETTVAGVLEFAVVRYLRDGNLDESFGNGGVVRTQIPGSTGDFAAGIALLRARIVVVGTSNRPGSERQDFAVVTYEHDGTLDPSFGTGGIVVTDFRASADSPSAVDIQPNGSIVVAGFGGGGIFLSDFAVARYSRQGRLDDSFGDHGLALVDLGPLDAARDLSVQPNGRIVTAGTSGRDIVLLSLDKNGALNGDFGSAGIVRTDLGSIDAIASAIASHRGKLVVVGSRTAADFTGDFAVLRYERDGALDDSFGSGGVVVSDLGGGTSEFAVDAAVEKNRIVVAGTIQAGTTSDFVLARYLMR